MAGATSLFSFVPKGFIDLAEAIQRVGKHRHPDTWTGAETYHHEATDDWEVEHRLRDQCIAELAEICTAAFGPDWWMRSPGPEAETIEPADPLSELVQILGNRTAIDCSEDGIAKLWSALREAQDAGTLTSINEAEAAVQRAEYQRKEGRQQAASQMYELAAAEAAGKAPSGLWPSGYRTIDSQLPRLDPERYKELRSRQADALAVFQGKRLRWLDAVNWLQQECEADDIEAIIVEDGSRRALPTNLWAMNTPDIRSMLFAEGIVEFKVATGFGKAPLHRGKVLISLEELDRALGVNQTPASSALPTGPAPVAESPARRLQGRKPHKLRDECVAELVRIADLDGLSGYTLANLEKQITEFCREEFDDEPSEASVRDWLRLFTKRTTLKGDG